MLPRKILKILLLKLARIAFVASFPPILFIKSLFFKNFRNNSKFREKFNFFREFREKDNFQGVSRLFRETWKDCGGRGDDTFKTPPPTKNLLPLPTPVLKCFWKDPLIIPSTSTTPLQASFTADPLPIHHPSHPKNFDHTQACITNLKASSQGKYPQPYCTHCPGATTMESSPNSNQTPPTSRLSR